MFSARVEGNDKGGSQTEVCVSVCVRVGRKKEEKGEGRRNNDREEAGGSIRKLIFSHNPTQHRLVRFAGNTQTNTP